jgi:hypothetical protein
MGTGNRDASLTTTRRKQLTLWGARATRSSAAVAGKDSSIQVNLDVQAGAALAGRTNGNCACSGADITKHDRRSPAKGC